MIRTTLVHAKRSTWSGGVEIHIAVPQNDESKIAVAKPITMNVVEVGEYSEPSIRLDQTASQKLMDELWNCGIRPSEGTGSAGSLAATEKHLQDMRTIAFGMLKKDGFES